MKTTIKIWLFSLLSLVGTIVVNFVNGQTVVIDAINKKILVQSGDQLLSSDSFTGQADNTTSNAQIPIVSFTEYPKLETSKGSEKPNPLLVELQQGTELEKAIYRMYQNGLTKYEKLSDYRPEDPLLREEAAKIIGQAYTLLGFSQEVKNSDCLFADREQFDPSLTAFIQQTCKVAVFKGSQGKFHPRKALSKAEALTVLVRILEGKSSSEEFQPWRTLYFAKAKGISLTQETEVMALERPITRKEIALLIHRFKTILLNTQLKNAAKDQLSIIEKNPDAFLKLPQTSTASEQADSLASQATTSSKDNAILGIVSATGDQQTSSLSILNSPEVNEAIQWMHDHGMTSAKEIAAYQPFAPLTREQSAKMFAQFAKALAFQPLSGANTQCQFKDLQQGDASLRTSIAEVCQLGLMQGNGGTFSPKTELTKAQFITMLIRLSEGKHLNENENPRWIQYFLKAKELWILNNEDAIGFETPLTRYEAALFFYRFQLKQKIASHLNTETLKNEILSTKRTADGSFASGDIEGSYAVALDVNVLKNQFFQQGFVELLGERWGLKRTTMTVFDLGEESFVWYGDLLDLQKETKVWTVNFVVSNGNMIQGTIRFASGQTWLIKESKATTAWFNLIKG